MFILGATLWHLCLLERHSRNYIYIELHFGQIRYSNQVGCARKVGLTLLPLTPSQKKIQKPDGWAISGRTLWPPAIDFTAELF